MTPVASNVPSPLPPLQKRPGSVRQFPLPQQLTPDPERELILLSQSALSPFSWGLLVVQEWQVTWGMSRQNEGNNSNRACGQRERVVPIHSKENKRKQAAPAAMGHQPAILSTASQKMKPKLISKQKEERPRFLVRVLSYC